MEELLKRLSSYDLLNNLIPGGFLVYVLDTLFAAGLADQHLIVLAILTYFLGSVASRVGSLVIEPVLKRLKLLDSKPYPQFIEASKSDAKIEVLLQANNTYRSICGAALVALGAVGVSLLASHYYIDTEHLILGSSIGLVILYGLSVKKQTAYICQRIQHATDNPPETNNKPSRPKD